MSWEEKVSEKRSQLRSKIPKEWLLEDEVLQFLKNEKKDLNKNLDSLCSKLENEITNSTILKLREKLLAQELTCFQIISAFCHRAALCHQIVNCLTE